MESATKWVIFLVAFDDPELEPQVVAERVPADEDEQLAAFMRGGHVLEVRPGSYTEAAIEHWPRAREELPAVTLSSNCDSQKPRDCDPGASSCAMG